MEELRPYFWFLLGLTLLFSYAVYLRRAKWDVLRIILVLLAMLAGLGFLFAIPQPNVFKQNHGAAPGHLSEAQDNMRPSDV